MVLVIGITGASGAAYGIRLLQELRSRNVETHLIISEAGETVIKHETDWRIEDVRSLASFSYANSDMGARLASSAFHRDGMIVAPCTVKTMSALAYSFADNLLVRAGDVTLKERKRLLLVVRETPLHLGHIKTMERLTEMGAVIMPPVPAFYHRPQTVGDIVDYTVGKMLDVFGIEHDLYKEWPGIPDASERTRD